VRTADLLPSAKFLKKKTSARRKRATRKKKKGPKGEKGPKDGGRIHECGETFAKRNCVEPPTREKFTKYHRGQKKKAKKMKETATKTGKRLKKSLSIDLMKQEKAECGDFKVRKISRGGMASGASGCWRGRTSSLSKKGGGIKNRGADGVS